MVVHHKRQENSMYSAVAKATTAEKINDHKAFGFAVSIWEILSPGIRNGSKPVLPTEICPTVI